MRNNRVWTAFASLVGILFLSACQVSNKSIGISPQCPKIISNTPSPTSTSVVVTGQVSITPTATVVVTKQVSETPTATVVVTKQVSETPTATVVCVNGMVSTLAGTVLTPGYADGTRNMASFNDPIGITTDLSGNIYVADSYNNRIRKITPGGVVTTLAGSGAVGSSDGTGISASFNQPWGVAADPSGNIFVIDSGNNLVRKITPTGVVTTFATGQQYCYGIATDASGNVYVASEALCPYLAGIRKITPGGTVSTLVTGLSFYQIAVDGSGNLYATMDYNVYKIVSGSAVLLAGSGTKGYVDGLGTAASFGGTGGITTDPQGNLFVTDGGNDVIRKITPAGMVSTFAGQPGNSGSANGSALSATFFGPSALAFDFSGNLYISEAYNQSIREIQPCPK
jgi:hypothetical protein